MVRDRLTPLHHGGWRALLGSLYGLPRSSRKYFLSGTLLGRATEEGESPVGEKEVSAWVRNLSTAGHVKSCWKLGRPRSKAKYVIATDSAEVP